MGQAKKTYTVAIIGYGWVGRAYHKMFPDAVIYDEPQQLLIIDGVTATLTEEEFAASARKFVNECDLALVCVPTDFKEGKLDTSIVEEVCDWLETPLILIKSALQPGTVDRLLDKYKRQGYFKRIAVSVEMVGEGKYFIPFWKYPHSEDPTYHNFLIVGGEDGTARECANFLWAKMSPDINIHLTTAIEAEIVKMMENTWGAQKVTFANAVYDICTRHGANYTRVLQAWGADGRTEKMHMRVMDGKRGWKSKCYDKDVLAFAGLDRSGLISAVIRANQQHLAKND